MRYEFIVTFPDGTTDCFLSRPCAGVIQAQNRIAKSYPDRFRAGWKGTHGWKLVRKVG